MSHQLMTIVVRRPSDEAQLESFLLGLEVLWPFQIVAYAGNATVVQVDQQHEHETATHESLDEHRI
ncbi:hypothetical protein [Comamonas terrigena]|uniref:hypothetical protein n=1 Tax=Comamonas terrigena TaxID=32013 RepID=UPI0024484FF8|nr:hypothetical protein [Comamonas terrigena]MDH1501412.1 hypothetical protein [Comamonas terrigena]